MTEKRAWMLIAPGEEFSDHDCAWILARSGAAVECCKAGKWKPIEARIDGTLRFDDGGTVRYVHAQMFRRAPGVWTETTSCDEVIEALSRGHPAEINLGGSWYPLTISSSGLVRDAEGGGFVALAKRTFRVKRRNP